MNRTYTPELAPEILRRLKAYADRFRRVAEAECPMPLSLFVQSDLMCIGQPWFGCSRMPGRAKV